jgi:hypothetical protein
MLFLCGFNDGLCFAAELGGEVSGVNYFGGSATIILAG